MIQTSKSYSRDWRFDALRIVMSFFVVLLHVAAYGSSSMYGSRIPHIFNSIGRVAVPIFYMTSGAMALRKSETLAKTYTRGLKRILLPYIFAALFYSLYHWYCYGISPFSTLKALPITPPHYHLHFMHVMIELYLIFPLLNHAWSSLKSTEKLILALIVLCLDIPQVRQYVTIKMLGNHVIGYAMLGAALRDIFSNNALLICRPSWKKAFLFFTLWGIVSIFLAHVVWKNSLSIGYLNESAWTYQSLLVVISSISIYMGVMLIPQISITSSFGRFLTRLNALTLTIYIIHPVVLETIMTGRLKFNNIPLLLTWNSFSPLFCIPFLAFITYCISATISFIFSICKSLLYRIIKKIFSHIPKASSKGLTQ